MSNRLVVVGAGRISTDLLAHLSKEFEITCIDISAEALASVRTSYDSLTLSVLEGDATSRLVLEQAKVEEADIILLTVSKENINLEVARILREKFQVSRIISIGITAKGVKEMEKLDVEVANIFQVAALSLLNLIRGEIRTPQGIGRGEGEILELTVHPQSRLVGKPLRRLAPKSWQVGLVFRNETLMVPDGSLRLRPRDRVIILGEPNAIKTVSELLTFSAHDFPLEYGTLALVFVAGTEGEKYFDEVEYLLNTFSFCEVVFMVRPEVHKIGTFDDYLKRCRQIYTIHEVTKKQPFKAIIESAGTLQRNCGLIIGDKRVLLGSPRFFAYRGSLVRLISATLERFYAPILFSTGTFPYGRIAVPGIPPADIRPLLETALEITEQLAAELTAFLCAPSVYTGGEDERVSFDEMKKSVSDMSLLFKQKIPAKSLPGNPVHEVTGSITDHHLLLLEPNDWTRSGVVTSFLNPVPVQHILAQSAISTLLLPLETAKKLQPSPNEKKS